MKLLKNNTFLLVFLVSAWATASQAQILVNDTFTDGGFTNGADALDVAWTQGAGAGAPVLSIVSTVATGALTEGNNALYNNNSGTFNFALMGASFGTQALAIGDSLTLTLGFRFTAAPAANGAGFRFGLGSAAASYGASFQTGTGVGTGAISQYTGAADGSLPVLSGTSTNLGASGSFSNVTGTGNHTLAFSVTRTATSEVSISATVNGNTLTATDTTAPFTSFTHIIFQQGNVANDYAIDNVVLNYTAIPEPSTYALLGISLAAMLWLRRKPSKK